MKDKHGVKKKRFKYDDSLMMLAVEIDFYASLIQLYWEGIKRTKGYFYYIIVIKLVWIDFKKFMTFYQLYKLYKLPLTRDYYDVNNHK